MELFLKFVVVRSDRRGRGNWWGQNLVLRTTNLHLNVDRRQDWKLSSNLSWGQSLHFRNTGIHLRKEANLSHVFLPFCALRRNWRIWTTRELLSVGGLREFSSVSFESSDVYSQLVLISNGSGRPRPGLRRTRPSFYACGQSTTRLHRSVGDRAKLGHASQLGWPHAWINRDHGFCCWIHTMHRSVEQRRIAVRTEHLRTWTCARSSEKKESDRRAVMATSLLRADSAEVQQTHSRLFWRAPIVRSVTQRLVPFGCLSLMLRTNFVVCTINRAIGAPRI